MKRFILSVLVLSLWACVAFGARWAWRIWQFRGMTDSVYTLTPQQDVLFIGSSSTACSVLEEPKYHNKIVWVYSSGPEFSLMRLQELDRRRQLGNVKILFVDFMINNFNHQSRDLLPKSWVRELPISWRHTFELPGSVCDLVRCMLERPEMDFGIGGKPPANRPSVGLKTKQWIEELPERDGAANAILNEKTYIDELNWSKGWRTAMQNSIIEMKKICDRHGIRFVLWSPPLPSFARARIPPAGNALFDEFINYYVSHGVEYVDFRTAFSDDTMFFDWWHLDSESMECFTDLFYRRFGLSVNK